jgi:hypothetical protein
MELRQLNHFVAVAEELHVARAASRVPIAQPSPSPRIQSSAQEFGDRLLLRKASRVEPARLIVSERAQCAFGFRPDRSASGRGAFGSISPKRAETSTPSIVAKASSVPTVTFSVPRSTRPTYERSISASRASRSCERPLTTRSLRRFQPILRRTSMPPQRHIRCLTIDGLSVPN